MEGANQVGGSRLVGCSDENGLLLGSRPTVVRVALFFCLLRQYFLTGRAPPRVSILPVGILL